MRVSIPLLLAFILVGCQPAEDGLTAAASPATENPLASTEAASGGAVPYVEIESAEALLEAIREVDAEIVLVNFWTTWCGPCRVEFPDLVRFDAEKEGVEVRFVSLDIGPDVEFVQPFLDDHGVSDPSFLYTGPGEPIGEIDPLVGGGVLPVTMAFDQDGTLLKSHLGLVSYDWLDQFITDATSA